MTEPLRPFDPRGTVLGDEVYARLGEAIVQGALAPGERLRDHELARRLDVSRTPVREALQRLERIGLVEVAPNRYTRVSIPSEKGRQDMREFVVLAAAASARFAVQRGTHDDCLRAVALADEVVAASADDDWERIVATSSDLFTHLLYVSGNITYLKIMNEARFAISRYTSEWRPYLTDVEERTHRYRSFRDALAAREAGLAEQRMRSVYGLD